METKKGLRGRIVCGILETVFGGFLLVGVLLNTTYGAVNIPGFFGAVFIILTGNFGIASKTPRLIIGYLVTGIICSLGVGLLTIGGIVVVANYEHYAYYFAFYGYHDESAIRSSLLVAVLIIAVAFLVSVLGVIFACVPLCAKNHRQNAFQFQQFHEPVGVVGVGPPPNYNYSNTGYIHTAQTQQNDYGNKPLCVGGVPSNFNNSNTASVDTKQVV